MSTCTTSRILSVNGGCIFDGFWDVSNLTKINFIVNICHNYCGKANLAAYLFFAVPFFNIIQAIISYLLAFNLLLKPYEK